MTRRSQCPRYFLDSLGRWKFRLIDKTDAHVFNETRSDERPLLRCPKKPALRFGGELRADHHAPGQGCHKGRPRIQARSHVRRRECAAGIADHRSKWLDAIPK